MKKLISKPIVLDIIKVVIIFGTLRILNIYHKSEHTTSELVILLTVILGVKFFLRNPKPQL
jgi:hypothetical protein